MRLVIKLLSDSGGYTPSRQRYRARFRGAVSESQ